MIILIFCHLLVVLELLLLEALLIEQSFVPETLTAGMLTTVSVQQWLDDLPAGDPMNEGFLEVFLLRQKQPC